MISTALLLRLARVSWLKAQIILRAAGGDALRCGICWPSGGRPAARSGPAFACSIGGWRTAGAFGTCSRHHRAVHPLLA